MKTILDLGVIAVTITMMIAVGVDLEASRFRRLCRQPARFLALLALVIVLPPLVGLAAVAALRLPQHLACALLLVAACPVGDIANFFTSLARGNVAASLALNGLTCLLAPLTMSLAFAGFQLLGNDNGVFAAPGLPLIGRLLLFLLIPALAGAVLRHWSPVLASRLRAPLHRFTAAGILFLVALVAFSQHRAILRDGPLLALGSATLLLGSLGAALAAGRLLRLEAPELRALATCAPIRNIAVASLLAVTLLDRLEFASAAAVYFVTEALLFFAVSFALRRPGPAR